MVKLRAQSERSVVAVAKVITVGHPLRRLRDEPPRASHAPVAAAATATISCSQRGVTLLRPGGWRC
jgi:hypothetical protein